MPHRAPRLRPRRTHGVAVRLAALLGAVLVSLGPLALTSFAAEGLTMTARILVQGHARVGAWAAIEVDLQNDGPTIQGELRMDGGAQSSARFAMAVDLPTGSRQRYILHAQPPPFGRNVKVELVADGVALDSVDVAYLVHESNQLVVGVLAERPQALISQIDLQQTEFGVAPALVPLTVGDLPERAEGWGVLDRIVWQDIDSNLMNTEQLTALRHWLAAGGRLVILGGSTGIGTLSAFPDDILPFRPSATLDLEPTSLVPLLGQLPDGATSLPAMSGALDRGRALATSGDRVVAAELKYGSGVVTLLGFDPTTAWLAESAGVDALWRSALPQRLGDGSVLFDDSQLVQAVHQLPVLALPPTSGLLIIIGAYILIIGPINYLILKRLDRRELAWVTMPVLVLAFTAASFGYGAFLRGTDVVVNEVAIVRGAPDATEATAQVYFGVFSPTRSTYQVLVPQGALLASPINSDPFGQSGQLLDIVQGTGPERPSAVRNLTVGTSSLRIVRAQLPVAGPRVRAALALEGNVLAGTVENASDQRLENVAVVLGGSVAILGDVDPRQTMDVRLTVRDDPFGAGLADQVIGSSFDNTTEAGIRRWARYALVSQLTYDPTGMSGGRLPADQAVILAFGRGEILDLQVGSEAPRRNGNILYYVPVSIGVGGSVTFSSDLLKTTMINSDAQFFSKEGFFLHMGAGTATLTYRPITFDGRFDATQVRFSLGQGGGGLPGGGQEIEPLGDVPIACTDLANTVPEGCQPRRDDFLPEVDVFDLSSSAWRRLPRLLPELAYTLKDPARYVDAATGQMLVRFVNDNPESSVDFAFQVALTGDVE